MVKSRGDRNGERPMKIRQESAIRRFLTEALGKERGRAVFHRQQAILQALIDATCSKTKNQRRTLARTILPRTALYKALSQDGVSQEEAYGAECPRRENSALRAGRGRAPQAKSP